MSNFNFNEVMLGGRLCEDTELRTTPSGVSVTRFLLAVSRRRAGADGKVLTDFFNVVAWRGTAEFICKYFKKGSAIFVTGELHTTTWTDNAGVKRYGVELICDDARFVDSKSDGASAGTAAAPVPEYETVPDEELPF